ncbi:MAG: polysaccharide deacetylase family protein [Spirochaetes bacterium]|nr:polysaccharide deacetylase family protein [Spirochaetota bacterium]
MKRIFPLTIVLICFVGFVGLLFWFIAFSPEILIMHEGFGWKVRKSEQIDRMLKVPLLLYHNIDGVGQYSLDYDRIRMHFDFFRQKSIRIIPLEDFIARLDNPRPYTEKVAVVTFDDGYPAMYSALLPLVEEFNYPVTLFVVIDAISTKAHKALTWRKLRQMDSSGIRIECHSMTHRDLVHVYNRLDAESKYILYEEIYLSKRVLELYLGRKISFFAFPYGRYNLPLVDLCKAAGYSRAFSTDFGPNIITRNNYCLRRRTILRNSSQQFLSHLVE